MVSLISRGRRRPLPPETQGATTANLEIQRRRILTSHILLNLRDFLTQVTVLDYGKKETLLVNKSNKKYQTEI